MAETFATFVPFTAQTRMSGVDLYDDDGQPRCRVRRAREVRSRAPVVAARRLLWPSPTSVPRVQLTETEVRSPCVESAKARRRRWLQFVQTNGGQVDHEPDGEGG